MDTYIRAYMDEAGFVPIALVCGYPNVAAFGAYYADIVARIQERILETTSPSVIEVDAVNETIRLKVGWEMVISVIFVAFHFVTLSCFSG